MQDCRHAAGRLFGQSLLVLALLVATTSTRVEAQSSSAAQGTIRGTVKNVASGLPLGNAQVFVVGTTTGGLTNGSGVFTITGVPSGTQIV
ncbi:MAG TPA: hypothetical protein VE869_17885, partial [Gemmatimonas sp.]|nr:hypothetical protein [Gemmatimonas sp.]